MACECADPEKFDWSEYLYSGLEHHPDCQAEPDDHDQHLRAHAEAAKANPARSAFADLFVDLPRRTVEGVTGSTTGSETHTIKIQLPDLPKDADHLVVSTVAPTRLLVRPGEQDAAQAIVASQGQQESKLEFGWKSYGLSFSVAKTDVEKAVSVKVQEEVDRIALEYARKMNESLWNNGAPTGLLTESEEPAATEDYQDRQGKFVISERIIKHYPQVVREVMAMMIIVRAEFRWDHRAIEYTAMSPMFEVVAEGERTPEYHFQMQDNLSWCLERLPGIYSGPEPK